MKKELKTKQDYLDAHLKEFEAIVGVEKVKGIIFVEDNNVFLLQNKKDGIQPMFNYWKEYGYKYSHQRLVFDNTSTYFHSLTIEVEEEWKPQFGELVFIPKIEENRIFLFEKDGMYACVAYGNDEHFKKNHNFEVSFWEAIHKIEEPKLIEITLEEAKSIIAKEKSVKVEQINLNFNIK